MTELTLRIYGGSAAEGMNPAPLVSVGAAPQGFQPASPTIVDEPHSWMIAHAQDYTLYALHSREFKTAEGEDGQLLICLFFTPQRRLGEGKSPLALLGSIRDLFLVLGAPEGCLPKTPLDSSPFRMVLGRYPLEDRPVLLPVMQGHETASYCLETVSQLDALMRHSRYDALAKVGRLELGFHCPTTVALKMGAAPKKPVEPAPAPKPAPAPAPVPVPEPEPEPEPIQQPVPEPDPIPQTEEAPEPKPKKKNGGLGWWVFVFIVIIASIILALYQMSEPAQAPESPEARAARDIYDDYRALVNQVSSTLNRLTLSPDDFELVQLQLDNIRGYENRFRDVDSRYSEWADLRERYVSARKDMFDSTVRKAESCTRDDERADQYYLALQYREDSQVRKKYNELADKLQGILRASYVMAYRSESGDYYAESVV